MVSTETVSMEDNVTRPEEVEINKITYPLYAICMKMLRSVKNLLIVNLLFSDLVHLFVRVSYTMYLAFVYFFTLR